jgi:hypothetical protein
VRPGFLSQLPLKEIVMAKKKAKKGGKKKKKKKASKKKKSSKKKATRRVAGKKKAKKKKKAAAKPARPRASPAMTASATTPSTAAVPGARTALNPAAAWPFPTGSRP